MSKYSKLVIRGSLLSCFKDVFVLLHANLSGKVVERVVEVVWNDEVALSAELSIKVLAHIKLRLYFVEKTFYLQPSLEELNLREIKFNAEAFQPLRGKLIPFNRKGSIVAIRLP